MKYVRLRFLGAVFGMASWMVCPAYARAAPAHSLEEARVFQVQGRKELDAERYEQAAALLEKAHAVLNDPSSAIDLMKAYGYLEKHVEAWQIGEEMQRRPAPPGESKTFVKARQQINEAMDALSTLISFLVLHFDPPRPLGVDVMIDGKRVPDDALSKPYPVNRGTHVVVSKAPGYYDEQKTQVIEGKTSETYPVSITMRPVPVPKPPPEAKLTIPWVLFGTSAAVAAGLGIGAGLVYRPMAQAFETPDCNAACKTQYNERKPFLPPLTISAGAVGALSLGTLGFILYKTLHKPAKSETALFIPSTNGGSFMVRW